MAKSVTCRRTGVRWQPVLTAALGVCFLIAAFAPANATRPFVWSRAGDALTLDPHAVNEGTTHALNHHIYETLVVRGRSGNLEPALAQSWKQSRNPKRWTFELRRGVTFHDGTPFTAADVVFSLRRALSPTSDLRTRLEGVTAFKALAPNRVEITTSESDPLLPIRLTDIFIMSQAWAEKHNATVPQNYLGKEPSFAATNANGTGPYRLVARQPGKETRLIRNADYWGWADTDLSRRIAEIIYRPISNDQQRITALLEGSVDFVQDVPLSELGVLRQAPDVALRSGPENRVIFLGLSVRPETPAGQPNPLAKAAVRRALSLAIDRSAIQRDIMQGQSIPTGVLAPPAINGFPTELDRIPERDPAGARVMLQAAGVTEGTALTLDCPNNRYVNDAAICRAIAGQLADVGLVVTPKLRPKEAHFRRVRAGQSQFYLLGWGVPTFDSAYIFTNLLHTRTATRGTWNGTGFSDPALDRQIRALANLDGNGDRARALANIWLAARKAMIYIPIHVQTLIYAMRRGVDIDVDISNAPKLKDAVIDPARFTRPTGGIR